METIDLNESWPIVSNHTQRKEDILEQTRNTYCRQRQEVEEAIEGMYGYNPIFPIQPLEMTFESETDSKMMDDDIIE